MIRQRVEHVAGHGTCQQRSLRQTQSVPVGVCRPGPSSMVINTSPAGEANLYERTLIYGIATEPAGDLSGWKAVCPLSSGDRERADVHVGDRVASWSVCWWL